MGIVIVKKTIGSFLILILFMVAYSTNASALKAKDYMPSNKYNYFTSSSGYDPYYYTLKSKDVYKKGYWYNYDYEVDGVKNKDSYHTKTKYVMKKDGLYIKGSQSTRKGLAKIESKTLPKSFKKGSAFKTTFKAVGYKTATYNNRILSTNGTIKIGKKKYKNVVKVKTTLVRNKKNIVTQYYVKNRGVVKTIWSNTKNGVTSNEGSSKVVKITKR